MECKARLLELRAASCEARALFERVVNSRRRIDMMLVTDQSLIEATRADERELMRWRLRLVCEQDRAERAIATLKNPNLRALMRMRYLLGVSWAQIGAEMRYSRSQLCRMHRVALERMQWQEGRLINGQG